MVRQRVKKLLAAMMFASALAGCGDSKQVDESGVDFSTLNFIVPSSVGGGSDLYARQIIPHMAKHLGVNFAIRNLPGDGTLRGVAQAARAQPDGATLTTFNPPSITAAQLQRGDRAPVDVRELTYIGQWGTSSMVLFANREFPHRAIPEIIEHYAQGNARVIGVAERGGVSTLHAALVRVSWD